MKILALDLGTKTGWAYYDGSSGTWDLSPRRHESAGMRWIKFRQSLDAFLNRLDLIVYEEVARHLGTHAAHIYGGFVSTLQHWCEEHGIEYQGVPVGTIKKFATGKGNANKKQMIDAAKNFMFDQGHKIHYERIDDNEADAFCLMVYAKDQYKPATAK